MNMINAILKCFGLIAVDELSCDGNGNCKKRAVLVNRRDWFQPRELDER